MEQASAVVFGPSSASGLLVGARNFFSDVFRSYMSGNKPLNCGNVISGIALIELTLYNIICIDKWLSTRPVLDAGLLPGIGAERSVK